MRDEQFEHIAIVLEGILAELRSLRGTHEEDEKFFAERSADFCIPLAEFQRRRRSLRR